MKEFEKHELVIYDSFMDVERSDLHKVVVEAWRTLKFQIYSIIQFNKDDWQNPAGIGNQFRLLNTMIACSAIISIMALFSESENRFPKEREASTALLSDIKVSTKSSSDLEKARL